MTKKKKIHIVPHTHWDKEWYFTSSRSKIYLMRQIQEIMSVLVSNPAYASFLLDGQTSLIEDYLRYYPEDKNSIKDLIRSQKLLVGPWYTQTDQLIISSESIVRNLFYGIKGAENFGHSMKVAYAPDAFGQGGNMPQIYKQFGIDYFLFWRGLSDDRLNQLEFIWQGADGTQLLANQMYFAYYYGLNIPQNPETLLDYISNVIDPLEKRATSKAIYFPSGGDQSPIQHNLVDVVKNMNEKDQNREYVISNPENFFEDMKHSVSNLPIIEGAMLEGKNSRIHKSIYSTRADLKQSNNRVENMLTNILEPLLSISYTLGNKYPHKEIEEIWKLLFENAAHDSIGGCNSDETNQDIAARYKLAEDLVTNLLDLHKREIAMNVNQNEKYAITIFNTLPYERSQLLDTHLYIPDGDFKIIDDLGNEVSYSIVSKEDQSDYLLNQFAYLTPHLYRNELNNQYIPKKVYYAHIQIDVPNVPALGYSQLYLLPDESGTFNKSIEVLNENKIENKYYQIMYKEKTNSFTIINKENQKKYDNQFVLVDNGDAGDSYNYSPPVNDWIISSQKEAKNITISTKKNGLTDLIHLKYELVLPANLEERSKQIKSTIVSVSQKIILNKDEKLVRSSLEIDNVVKDHRMCIQFSTDIQSEFSISDSLFGVEKSDLRHPAMDYWEKDKWTEAPISINPMQSFVALTDENTTVAVITSGVREYEIIGDEYNIIQLTLFRCFGYMGKENLLYRPGRASGEKIVKTPDAQLQGNLTFDTAVVYEEKNFDHVSIAKISKEFLTPLVEYELTDFLNGRTIFKKNNPIEKKLNTKFSLMDFENSHVILSTIKKAEIGDHLIFRIYNPFLSKEIDISNIIIDNYQAVGLDELKSVNKSLVLKHNQFQSFAKFI